MGWLWESEREERPRKSGLKFIVLGGLAAVAGAAGFFLIGGKEPGPAAAPAAAAQLDCTSPRNAWRAACSPVIADAPVPASSEAIEEAPKATGALPSKTAKTAPKTVRASSKPAKPDAAAPETTQKPVEEVRAEPEDRPLPARTTAALDNPPAKVEPAALSLPEPRTTQQQASPPPQAAPKRIERTLRHEPTAAKRAVEEPARLARHRVKPMTAVRTEPSRPALQAAKLAPQRPARIRDTGEGFARFRQPGADTVAVPDGRRVFVERSPREAFAGGRDAYRESQWKVTTYRDPIDW